MKNKILSILLVALVASLAFGATTYSWKSLTTTGTTTADAVYTARANRATSLLAVYQGITATTNDCDAKVILYGLTSSEAVTKIALADVELTDAIEMVGEGDLTATVDHILLLPGDQLWLDATRTDATNCVYKILIKETDQ